MSSDRLSLAHDLGAVVLPEDGLIGLYADETGEFPEILAPDRVRVITPWRQVVDRLEARGVSAAPSQDGPFAASVVQIPRSRVVARHTIAHAMAATASGGLVLVDGQKTQGIDALLREVRARVPVVDSFVKSHGRLFWAAANATAFTDWIVDAQDTPQAAGFYAAPGTFSADGPDPASVALAAALPAKLPARIADLGAGWGYLTAQILTRTGVASVDAVEAHHGALEAARRNISDPRVRFHWADATRWHPDAPLDAIIMNPPFHSGRAADPSLGLAFLQNAARALGPRGMLWLVANRQLPYEETVSTLFARMETLPAPAGFKIIVARTPRRTPGSGVRPDRSDREPPRDIFR